MARVVCVCALLAHGCSPDIEGPSQAGYSVRGSGLIDLRKESGNPSDLVVQNRISAYRDGNDQVSGSIETIVSHASDRSLVPWILRSTVDCLVVEGRDAWIGGTVVTSNVSLASAGDRYLVFVGDRGGPGRDVMHAAFAKDLGDAQCADKPAALTETLVELGDYVIRDGAPSTQETTGTLRVTVITTGPDADTDGYEVSVGPLHHPVAIGATLTLASLFTPGEHDVTLEGVASNCTVSGRNTRSVTVRAGETLTVTFTVVCNFFTGSVRVHTTTSGTDLDPDGYRVTVDGAESPVSVAVNGVTVVGGIRTGAHSISLVRVAPNCSIQGGTIQVTISAPDEIRDVEFAVVCGALGTVQVTVATSGSPFAPDGYRALAKAGGGASFGAIAVGTNATVTIPRLAPGRHTVWLQGLPGNCGGAGVFPQQVDIPSGASATVAFTVECAEPSRLAYVSSAAGVESDIYAVRSDGSSLTQLTTHSARDEDPAWSPDGSRIAFTSTRDGPRSIYIMNEDGSAMRRLTPDGTSNYRPAWSPDGNRIAFVSDRDGNAEIYVMNADGTNVVRLTTHPAADTDPAWSPDANRLAFTSERTGNADIHVMNADGSNVSRVTTYELRDGQPAWSPDGGTLAFTRESCGAGWYSYDCYPAVIVAHLSGMFAVEVGIGEDPQWSPDGSRIAVTGFTCDFYYNYGAPPCTPSGIALLSPFAIPNFGYANTWNRPITTGIHRNPAWR